MLYRLITTMLMPLARWGRLRVTGLGAVPERGALLVVPNHDSQWDPLMVALALRPRRVLRVLARANLWRFPGLAQLLNGTGQIPLERGAGDARAIDAAVAALSAGDAIGVFPEGTLSRGSSLPARSGVARLWQACPQAHVTLCAVSGATGFVRFPRRPRVEVEFFDPVGGQPRADETPQALAARLLDEVRARVPPVRSGRRIRAA